MSKIAIAKQLSFLSMAIFQEPNQVAAIPFPLKMVAENLRMFAWAREKDLRSAVEAARGAIGGWASKSAFNRGQILYRMAEMLEGKRKEFVDILTETSSLDNKSADKEVDLAIDALVYFAGFSDKYQQVWGAVNPVSGPHHNFTTVEPSGTVIAFAGTPFVFSRWVSMIASTIVSGNSIVGLTELNDSSTLATLAEVFATSDLPKGVVNLISCDYTELVPHAAKHMEVNAIHLDSGSEAFRKEIDIWSADNMKRVHVLPKEPQSIQSLLNFVEFKTVWHPIGTSGLSGGPKY